MEGKPCGLLVNLEKDTLGSHHKRNDFVIGYFDRITILPIKHWLGFSPRNTVAAEQFHQSVSSYPIKLIFPETGIADELGKRGWDYESWRRLPESLFEENPCITAVLVNLTDAFKGNTPRDVCGEQLRRFIEVIENGKFHLRGTKLPFRASEFSDAHCCILPSLGYSDYCILFAEKSWSLAFALMEYLRQASCDGSPVLSTDYIVPVYHVRPGDGGARRAALIGRDGNSDMQMSMRVNLLPGVSLRMLERKLREPADGAVDIYHVSGSGDCLVNSKPGTDFSSVLQMLVSSHSTEGNSLGSLVMDTETLLQRLIGHKDDDEDDDEDEDDDDSPPPPRILHSSELLKDEIESLRCAQESYRDLLRAKNRHMRQFSALQQRLVLIENICGECHNRSLQEIMKQWLPAFTYCFERCVACLQNEEELPANIRKKMWARTEAVIEEFNGQVGSFLADLSRSDCFFMESERYNHPSVGSATALLIAYNQWQNSFAQAVMDSAGIGRSTYTFLIRCGGCDSTTTQNLFLFLEPEIDENGYVYEKLPFIIRMSELSLFDCGGTVFRMTHECMHFCGDRKRRERVEYLIRFVARLYGRLLSQVIFNKNAYYMTLAQSLKEQFQIDDEDLREKLERCWETCRSRLAEVIVKEITDQLTDALEKEQTGWTETNYMSSELRLWMVYKLFDLFSDRISSGMKRSYTPFVATLYLAQLETLKEYYQGCDNILRGHNDTTKHLFFCALERRRIETSLADFDTGKADKFVVDWISSVLSRLLSGNGNGSRRDDELRDVSAYSVVKTMRDLVFDCFSETYADLEACMRLEATIADYLLGFVFEEWDLDKVFPVKPPFICRIPPILRLYYPDYLDGCSLSAEARDILRDAAEHMKAHGTPKSRIDADALADRIDELLKEYQQEYHWEAKALEGYLTLCKESYTDADRKEMRRYREAFHKIRLLATENDSDSVTRIFTALSRVKEVSGYGAEL